MSRQEVRIFVSYSHRNRDGAARFLEAFEEYCRCSKTYAYRFWKDTELKIGERWEEAIRQNLTKSHCGLLLISPALLSSGYIQDVEIPALMAPGKILLPVGFARVDFQRHDLHGLLERQIFRLAQPGLKEPRFYSELNPKRRADFISALFTAMEERLDGALQKG